MLNRRTILFAAAAAPIVGAAIAQETTLPPRFGTQSLAPGFTPDPYPLRIQAGGNIRLESVFRGCPGWVDSRPDFNVIWSGGSRLSFTMRSNVDTVLLVNCAAGRWHCDDDSRGQNPVISFGYANRGRYNIWVGTYERQLAWVDLLISEFPV
jgi:hypothetical protein